MRQSMSRVGRCIDNGAKIAAFVYLLVIRSPPAVAFMLQQEGSFSIVRWSGNGPIHGNPFLCRLVLYAYFPPRRLISSSIICLLA